MTAMANMGNFIVTLPPSDIWLIDDQAAEFLSYEKRIFQSIYYLLKRIPKTKVCYRNCKRPKMELETII